MKNWVIVIKINLFLNLLLYTIIVWYMIINRTFFSSLNTKTHLAILCRKIHQDFTTNLIAYLFVRLYN